MEIIAEIGSVHNGSLKLAFRLIDTAKDCGATTVKFQTHIAEAETLKDAPSPKYFSKEKRYNYFKRTSFNINQWKKLKDYSEKRKIKFLSSPFSLEAVDLLEKINIRGYKIPSGEITNIPLIEKINKINKPTFISSGMSNWKELDLAIKKLKNVKKLTIMQCTSLYPCPANKVGLNIINKMRSRYKRPIGFSDHTIGITASILSIFYNVSSIEKHLTLSRKMYGSDAFNALEPNEFKLMVDSIKETKIILDNKVNKNDLKELKGMKRIFEKSIVIKNKLKKGEIIRFDDITFKKPGNGISPKNYKEVIGKKTKKNLNIDHILKKGDYY